MTTTEDSLQEDLLWRVVEAALISTLAISWDGCHKIYLCCDEKQVANSARIHQSNASAEKTRARFDRVNTSRPESRQQALETVQEWFYSSCGLRFVNAVQTNRYDPNAGYTTLIDQGEL